MGMVHLSPKLQCARDRITYLELPLSWTSGCKVRAKLLITYGKKVGFTSEGMSKDELSKVPDGI